MGVIHPDHIQADISLISTRADWVLASRTMNCSYLAAWSAGGSTRPVGRMRAGRPGSP